MRKVVNALRSSNTTVDILFQVATVPSTIDYEGFAIAQETDPEHQ